MPLDTFKRDAIALKAISLAAFAWAYLAAPPDFLSLAVVACGFLLNAVAARALGPDRTYYGHEVAGLPLRRITVFPYSTIPHPMLLGNMAAYAGTLFNAGFREAWWPLACAHVALNLGLLVMELVIQPRRLAQRGRVSFSARSHALPTACCLAAAGAVLGGVAGSGGTWGIGALPGTVIGAAVFGYAAGLFFIYASPASPPGERRETQAEDCS